MVSAGSVFKDGETLNYGGLIFALRQRGTSLWLGCPRIEGDSVFDDEGDVSPLLSLLAREIHFARSLGVEPEQVNLWDKVVLEEGCLSETDVFMERTPDAPSGDSGWFIGRVVEGEGERVLTALRVWHLLRLRPRLVDAMALPRRFLVVWHGDDVVGVQDANGNERWGLK
ncbi:hypothetical protein A176_002480 [Myxococcus hansupus]|uniref:Imm33-like domain-containing protein n=2 Tax=Pseudomyxococcus hansupus TaxID=1297742 RepID=A0A0H4WVE9_9BACT|nr:hypothetical protein A176_002480 [Myxococcus hansupus]